MPGWITTTILRQAEKEGDVILWDGGNNDTLFYRPDLDIVVLDPHRAGHELAYYPGEVNFRTADVLIINKVDTADPDGIKTVRQNIALHNPKARVIETACRVTVDDADAIAGKTVLVVEDGPTLTHGEMAYGAGLSRPIAITRQLWSILGPMPLAPSRRPSRSSHICGGFCRPWATAICSGTNWKRPFGACPAIWSWSRLPSTWLALSGSTSPAFACATKIEELGKPAIPTVLQEFSEAHQPALAEAGR